jgi:hypothetical protein
MFTHPSPKCKSRLSKNAARAASPLTATTWLLPTKKLKLGDLASQVRKKSHLALKKRRDPKMGVVSGTSGGAFVESFGWRKAEYRR